MEDKLFYFPETQSPSEVLWKDLKNSVQTQTSEWTVKEDSSGVRIADLSLNYIHKLYVTLVGGGGSGSLGEKRPVNNYNDYGINNGYTPYTNMIPLPGCGGGGGATIFRIPIILIQSQNTSVEYIVGRGGAGMIDTSDSPLKTAQERVGKSGEDTSIIIRQSNTEGIMTKIFKVKAVGGGGGGVVGYTKSREYLWNHMTKNDVKYIWDWSFGAHHSIDGTAEELLNEEIAKDAYLAEGNITPDGAVSGALIALTVFAALFSFGTLATVVGSVGFAMLADLYYEKDMGNDITKNYQRFQWWNVRHDDDKKNSAYYQYTHLKRLAEDWTIIFKRPAYGHVAFHRELDFPIGSDMGSQTAENRNEYIPYNYLTHGVDGISRFEYFKPHDKIKLSYNQTEKYFGGKLEMAPTEIAAIQIRHNNSNELPGSAYIPSDSGFYKIINDVGGVDAVRHFNNEKSTDSYYNFLWQYAPEEHYIDNRSWVQIWGYNVDRLRGHPRYYLRTGDTYLYKDKSSIFPPDSYLPTQTPIREKITIFADGKEDIVLPRWSPEFKSLMADYGGPVRKIPQGKGTTGAFGGAGGGFLHYDDPVPHSLHGLYGGKEMYNVWKIPESGRGGNPYPKQIWKTIDVNAEDASGNSLGGAYYYWGGEGYEDADSRGRSAYMTMHFIPGSGGGAIDYHHQNNRLSKRKYTDQEVDFQDILPAMSESPFTVIDNRVYKWYAKNHDELATGGKINYRLRDASSNNLISRLYMNDLYGTHKINFTNRGETGARSAEDLLMIFGAGGGGGKAFYFTPGNGQENPDMEPNIPGYGCGSGGSCSLNLDGEAAIIGTPSGSVDWYLRRMISYDEADLYTDFHSKATARIYGAFAGVITAIMILNIIISIVQKFVLPGIGEAIAAVATGIKQANKALKAICSTLYKVYNFLKNIYNQIKELLKSIGQHIRAFFKKIFIGGGSFSSHLKAIKQADIAAKILANQMKEAAKQASKAVKIAGIVATSKEKLIYHLKKIPSYLFSLLTGELGDVAIALFDNVAAKTAKKAFLAGEMSSRIVKLVLANPTSALTAALKPLDGVIGGLAKNSGKFIETAAEIASDVGRAADEAFNSVDNIAKNVDGLKAATNVISDNIDQVKVGRAHDNFMTSVEGVLGNTRNVDGVDGAKLVDDAADNTKFIDVNVSPMSPLDQKAALQQMSDSLAAKAENIKAIGTDSQKNLLKQMQDRIAERLANANVGGDVAVSADNVAVSMDDVGKARSNPETLNDVNRTLTPDKRQKMIEVLDEKLADTLLDSPTKDKIRKLRDILADNQNWNIKYKHTNIPNSNTIELINTVTTDVADKLRSVVFEKELLELNDEIAKIFFDNPALLNSAKNGQAPAKASVVKTALGTGEDMTTFMNKNQQMLDEFVGSMKNGELKNFPREKIATFDANQMSTFVDNLSKNENFQKLIASNPQQLEDLKYLTNMSADQFSKVKLDTFGNIAKQNSDYIPNLMKGMTVEDVKAFKKLPEGGQNSDLFIEMNRFIQGKNLASNVENGKAIYKLDGQDVTALMDEFSNVKKANIENNLNDPNKLLIKDLNGNPDIDPTIDLKERTLDPTTQENLKKAGFDMGRVDDNVKSNLFDNVSNDELAKQIKSARQTADEAFTNSKNFVLESAQKTGADPTASLEALDVDYQRKIKSFDEALTELNAIKETPMKDKIAQIEGPKAIDKPNFAKQQEFTKKGVESVNEDGLNSIVKDNKDLDPEKLEEAKGQVNTELEETNKAIEKRKIEIEEANAKKAEIEETNKAMEKRYRDELESKASLDQEYKKKHDQWKKEYETYEKNIEAQDAENAKEAEAEPIRNRNKEKVAKIKENFQGSLDVVWREDPKGVPIEGEPVFYENKFNVFETDKETGTKLVLDANGNPIKKDTSVIKLKGKTIQGDTVIVDFTQDGIYKPGREKFKDKNLSNYVNLEFNTKFTGSQGGTRPIGKTRGKTRLVNRDPTEAVQKLANLRFEEVPKIDYTLINTQFVIPPEPTLPNFDIPRPIPLDPPTIPTLDDLIAKRDLLRDTASKLDNIQKQAPMRTFKPTPVAPPPAIVKASNLNPPTISFKSLTINPEVSLKPIPENNYEYLFTLYTDPEFIPPSKVSKNPVENAIPKMSRKKPLPTPDPTIVPKDDMIKWIKINTDITLPRPPLRIAYHLVYGLNRLFNTNEFSQFKPMKYRDSSNNQQEINPEIMLHQTIVPTNFINNCVADILDKKPDYDETRTLIYEDVFMELFDYPTKIEKSEIDNEMIATLMEQRRRGIAIDVEYMKKFVDYDKLSIHNKLNYQYLLNDFTKVQGLLFNQINIIKKNHMIFV